LPPGKLLLDISATTTTIVNDLRYCKHAFPADMDGDGDMDVIGSATSGSSNYKVVWFENDGCGCSWDQHIISQNYAVIRCAYPADLDGDGDLDVVGANTAISKDRIEWWRNDDGVGDIWTKIIAVSDVSIDYVCCADINGDDALDIVAHDNTSTVKLIAWWESMTFPPDSLWDMHLVSGGVYGCEELFPVDLDLDGDMDILSASDFYSWGLRVCENIDGLGMNWSITRINSGNDDATSGHAGDIDGDGDLDVIACGEHHVYLSWFENLDGSCTNWEEHILDTNLEDPHEVHAADLTDDGYCDILVAAGENYLYRNMYGAGSEWAKHFICSGSRNIKVADFNSDGKTDVLTVSTVISWHDLTLHTSGWLESSILDVASYPQWDSITWMGEEPLGTDIFFQIRTSNDWEDMGIWCDTIFEPQSLVGIIDSTHRYIQYRVGMTAEDEGATPILDEVRFYWTYLGIESGEEGPIDFIITAAPNPSTGAVSIMVPIIYSEDVQILVYDITGKVITELSVRDVNMFQWDCRDASGDFVPAGIYIIRGIVGDRSTSVRFVKL